MPAIIKIPSDVRVVDMCIYIDNNVYKEQYDETKIYEYLYSIVYLLSVKHKLFTEWSDYEPFSLYAAGKLYLRLTDKRQFLPENDKKRLAKITSILNYIKTVLHPYVVDYQQENYAQYWSIDDEDIYSAIDHAGCTKTLQDTNGILRVEVEQYLSRISTTIQSLLKRTPYSNNRSVSKNIYMSCLLTLLKSMTLSKENAARLNNRLSKGNCTDYLLEVLYRMESSTAVTLYHLPDSMHNYIATLTNRIRKLISEDLCELIRYNQPSEEMIKCILSSSMESKDANDT